MAAGKTVCPITREQFKKEAQPITIIVKQGDKELASYPTAPMEFGTDLLGYHANQRLTLMVGKTPVVFITNLQLIAAGSKELPGGKAAAAAAEMKAAATAKK
jgi:hypothetical protein